MSKLGQTPSQTVGPYFPTRLGGADHNVLPVSGDTERIVISVRVLDGDANHVEDALLETWQANPAGRYRHPDDRRDLELDEKFTGFARPLPAFETGIYELETVKPGVVPDPEGNPQAPHIVVIVQARGMLNPLFTRIYFSDESEANAHDVVLNSVPAERRSTLIARLEPGSHPSHYTFDLRLQGEDETVYFDV